MTTAVESEKRFIPSVRPRGIRPGAPTVQTVYQTFLKLDTSVIFDDVLCQVLEWVQEKYPEKLPDDAGSRPFRREVPGQRINCARHNNFWAIRLEQPDSPFQGRPAVGGRTWATDISISKQESGHFFGIKVLCASLPDCSEKIFLTRPRVVKDIADQTGLIDVIRISPAPLYIGKDLSIEEFFHLVTDPSRGLPVVVLSQPDKNRLPIRINYPYVLDENYLAEKIFGYAHAMVLPWEESFNWTAKVGKAWSVFNGAVRIYHTGLNFDTNPLYCHPLTLIDEILFWTDPMTKEIAERAFASFLINTLQTGSLSRRIDWSKSPFVNDVELMIEQAKQKKLSLLLETAESGQETRKVLESQKESQDREIALLKSSLKDKEGELMEYCDLATQENKDRSYYENENRKLRALVSSLRIQLEKKQQRKIDDAVKIPDSLEELDEWGDNLVGRVVLHPRAYQGAKKSCYANPILVYKTLLLLANEYRNMKIGLIKPEEYCKARDTLGLRDGPSIDEDHAGEYGNTYYIQYPIGSSARRFLELHLRCRGNTRDPTRCLAIYFFWDDESQQVVVGWLPSHLENKMT